MIGAVPDLRPLRRLLAILAALLVGSALLAPPAHATQVLLDAESRSIREGQMVAVYLTVVDGPISEIPQMPGIDGLRFTYQGQRQSTQIINMKTTRSVTFTYQMTALSAGSWTIPPVRVRAGKGSARSNSLTIEVAPREEGTGAEGASATLGADAIWVGQTVVYHVALRTRQSLLDLRWIPPEFEGFVSEQTADAAQREYKLAEGGVPWTVVELDVPLVATAAGAREIPRGIFHAQIRSARSNKNRRRTLFDPGFDTTSQAFPADPVPARVRPLPEDGRAADWSGLVGDFALKAELSDAQLALGESATLTITLEGDGTLSGFSLPEPDGGAAFRAYDDQPEVEAAVRGGRFVTVGRYRRAIVPEAEGRLELPPVALQIFDPEQGAYRTIETPPLALQVVAGESSDGLTSYASGAAPAEVAELADDILPIHPRARLRSQLASAHAPAMAAVVGLPALALIGLIGRDLRAARSGRRDPRRELKARVKGLEQAPLGVVEATFREALGLALGRAPASVDRAAVEAGLDEPLRGRCLAIYRDLDAARYGGGDPRGIARRAIPVIQSLLEIRP